MIRVTNVTEICSGYVTLCLKMPILSIFPFVFNMFKPNVKCSHKTHTYIHIEHVEYYAVTAYISVSIIIITVMCLVMSY